MRAICISLLITFMTAACAVAAESGKTAVPASGSVSATTVATTATATTAVPVAATLKASVVLSAKTIFPGEPVYADVFVENVSSKDVLLPAGVFSPGLPGKTGYLFSVIFATGSIVANSCGGAVQSDGPVPFMLKPGEFHGRKNIRISECFKFENPGKYSVKVSFISDSDYAYNWKGMSLSQEAALVVEKKPEPKQIPPPEPEPPPAKIVQKPAPPKEDPYKNTKLAASIITDWSLKYKLTTSFGYKKKLEGIGIAAVPAIAEAIEKIDDYSLIGDLLDLLGALPCMESGDELLKFIKTAGDRTFASNLPDGFSPASVLVGIAFQNLELMTGETLSLEKRIYVNVDTLTLWADWWEKNRKKFPPAVNTEKSIVKEKTVNKIPSPAGSNKKR